MSVCVYEEIYRVVESQKGEEMGKYFTKALEEIEERRIRLKRLVCDFVASMTDRGAVEFHSRFMGNDLRFVLDNFEV